MTDNLRTLKIQDVGDFHTKKMKPQILLAGQWLLEHGFEPSGYVDVSCPTPGTLVLCVKEKNESKNFS